MCLHTRKSIILTQHLGHVLFFKIQSALTDKAKIGILPMDNFVLEKIIFLAPSVARVRFFKIQRVYRSLAEIDGKAEIFGTDVCDTRFCSTPRPCQLKVFKNQISL